MVELISVQLRQLQMIELEMLIEVDRVCRKCNIHYNIIAGTMLGAIRHGGFIPWDDDADVAMLRTEYRRFVEACKTELDKDKYYFQDMDNTPGYRWGYGKLRRKDTLFIRENQEHMPYEQGVFIDIFPMDKIPQNKMHREIHNIHCYIIRKLLWSEVGKVSSNSFLIRQWYRLLSLIPFEIIHNHYNSFINRSNKYKSSMVRMLMFPSPTRDRGYDVAWYLKGASYKFEGYTFRGARDYDSYLRTCYGEYMSLPSKENRKVHPVSKIKLIEVDV